MYRTRENKEGFILVEGYVLLNCKSLQFKEQKEDNKNITDSCSYA
jgi:hypothetical protein